MTMYTHTTPPLENISSWGLKDMACILILQRRYGGLGLGTEDVLFLLRDNRLDGKRFINLLQFPPEDDDDDLSLLVEMLSNWQKGHELNQTFSLSMDRYEWFFLSLDADVIDNNYFIEKVLESISVVFDETFYKKVTKEENANTIKCLGGVAIKDAQWPFIMYKHHPRLDWRFSTHILRSVVEMESVRKARLGDKHSFSTSSNGPMYGNKDNEKQTGEESIHEYIAKQVTTSSTNPIFVLLALSGAGKSHTLFYLNTSNSAFTLPIDFGSIEDSSILLTESLDFINTQVKKLKENKDLDEMTEKNNQKIAAVIHSEIECLFALRGLMLLKLLKTRRETGQSLEPSMWIRYLYNEGTQKYKELYIAFSQYLRALGKKEFLQHLLSQLNNELKSNDTIKCKKVVLTVDEINPLIRLGHGGNKILTRVEKTSGSVATILFRILESHSDVVPSVISGTKIDTSFMRMVVSSRLKEQIEIVPYYGPTSQKELTSFASKYIFPKINDFLFKACCTILEGRRRAFMNFLSEIVNMARDKPCPKQIEAKDDWKQNLIIGAFLKYPPEEFRKDITNFLDEDEDNKLSEQMKKIRIDVALYLALKNTIQLQDIEHIVKKYLSSQKTKILDQIKFSIIYHGIAFGKISNGTHFESTEIVNSIHLNNVLHCNYNRALELVSQWLEAAFKDDHNNVKMDKNQTLGNLFELIGALIFLDIGKNLNGKPLTNHPLFEENKGSFLDAYTLPSKLSILRNKAYWKVFLMLQKYSLGHAQYFYRDVAVFGLDEGLKVDVKSLLIPVEEGNDVILEANMTSKIIINSSHDKDFENNFFASDFRNAFLCNDLQQIQKGMEKKREAFEGHVCIHNKSLRILFDYTFENTELFESLKKDHNKYADEIVLFSRSNEKFFQYFKENFPNLFSIIEENLKR